MYLNHTLKKLKNCFLRSGNGFTLLEVLLSFAVIAMLAAFSIPIYQSFQVKNDFDVTVNSTVQTLRRAQVLSQAVDGDTSWGVKLQSGSMVLFKGVSYASRDATYDEIFDVPTSITASGVTEVVYAKFTGLPVTTGNITLTSVNGDTKNIVINAKGMINY